jgi:hypothetical protein
MTNQIEDVLSGKEENYLSRYTAQEPSGLLGPVSIMIIESTQPDIE